MAASPHIESSCSQGCGCSTDPSISPMNTVVARLQYVTIGWMLVECGASLIAAVRAHSVALLAFGADSLIELLSAVVVLLQFAPRFALSREKAARLAAVLLYALAVTVVALAALNFGSSKESSFLGMGVTAAALLAMPVLAWLKRREALRLHNSALAADAAQSATCAYLAAVTLAGLGVFALWHIAWIDSVAALAAVPVLIVEGRRAWRGEVCGCSA